MIRDDIVSEARKYIGTKFMHHGRLINAGVDCVGVIVGVAESLNLDCHDVNAYSKIPHADELMPELDKSFCRIDIADMKPGDILVFWINRRTKIPQHLAIMTDKGMIHTYQSVERVVEHGLTKKWLRRLIAVFKFNGVD